MGTPLRKPTITAPSSSRLFRAAHQFFSTLKANTDILPIISAKAMRMLGQPSENQPVIDFCNTICDGVREAGLDKVFEQSEYTLQDIRKAARLVKPAETSRKSASPLPVACIYIWTHSKDKKPPSIYTGSTIDAGRRAHEHVTPANTMKGRLSRHYVEWRASTSHNNYIVCHTPKSKGSDVQFAIELFFVAVVMQSYASFMLTHETTQIKQANAFEVEEREGEEQGEDIHDTVMEQDPKNSMSNFRHIEQRLMATAVHKLAQEVNAKSGWRGGCTRPSFGASTGLNMGTPMTEYDGSESAPYAKVKVPGVIDVYTRSFLTVNVYISGAWKLNGYHSPGSGRTKAIVWKANTGPSPGTKVITQYEIYHSRPHPYSWSRLPELAETDDWSAAKALGIALLWKDDNGAWKKMYFQSSLWAQLAPGAPSKSYCDASSIVRSLRQEVIKDCPAFLGLFPPQNIFHVYFDWLSQTLFVNTRSQITERNPPKQNPRSNRVKRLKELGAKNFGVPFGTFPDGSGAQNRSSCDRCYIAGQDKSTVRGELPHGPGKCALSEISPGEQSCSNCWDYFKIRCSWTNAKETIKVYQDAVLHPKPAPDAIHEVPDPRLIDIYDEARQESSIDPLSADFF